MPTTAGRRAGQARHEAPWAYGRRSTTAKDSIRAHIQRCWLAAAHRTVETGTGHPRPTTGHELDRIHLITLTTTDATQAHALSCLHTGCGCGVLPTGGRRWRRCRPGVFGIDVMLIFFDTFTVVGTYVQRGL